MAGHRLLYRFSPGGVNGHHPYRLFTRVITVGLFVHATAFCVQSHAERAYSDLLGSIGSLAPRTRYRLPSFAASMVDE
jgi:hypothetical protein